MQYPKSIAPGVVMFVEVLDGEGLVVGGEERSDWKYILSVLYPPCRSLVFICREAESVAHSLLIVRVVFMRRKERWEGE